MKRLQPAAAEQGYPDAQVLLAFAYSIGEGVPQDDVAHMWVEDGG